MKLTTPIFSLALTVLVCIAITVMYFFFLTPKTALGAANEVPGTVATTSNPTVTNSASLVFASSTCGTRVITTYASPITLTFSDNQGLSPTGTFGTLQAASTTVAYSNGLYGCGAYRVFSYTTQAITVMESR